MQTGLYVSLSSQLALDRRLTTLADNVANSTTVGFRATEVKFNQVVSDQKVADVAFVSQGNEFLSTRAGGMTETGGTLDFAIKGDAWFQVETPSGPTLTRDGRFTLTDAGELVTLNGYAVLDAGGGPIDPQPRRRILLHRRNLHTRACAPRRRSGDGRHHRVSKTQRAVRLQDRGGDARACLHQPSRLAGQGRGWRRFHRDLMT